MCFWAHSKPLLLSSTRAGLAVTIALDGKVLRGSFDRFEDQKAAQILSAFCQREQLILGHLPVSSKTNEIPVAQQLMEELALPGVLYTLDALHYSTPSRYLRQITQLDPQCLASKQCH